MTRISVVVMLALVALCASACGKSGSIASPVAPSTSSSPATSGAVISGQVTAAAAASTGARRDTFTGVKVSIVGSDRSAFVDTVGRFRLDGVRSGETELQFEGQNVNVRVKIGQVVENERIELHISLSSGSGSIDASEHVRPDDSAAVFGRISAINGSSRSIQVDTFLAQVAASADIKAQGETVDFSALQVGQFVELEGSMQGNVMSATKVRIEDAANPNNGPPNANEVELTGSIASRTGTCPQLSFVVSGVTFVTGTSTSFERTSCGALEAGMLVQAKGTRQSNGSVAASRVRLE